MDKVIPGRYAAETEHSFVVFLIGMRINRLFAFRKWVPVAKAMGPMLQELYRNPDLGFLGAEYFLQWRGIMLVQYWRSYEHLDKYARGGIHLEAWKRFNRAIGTDGTVGIYHETYIVQPGQFECVYNNMPKFGLAKATKHVPAVGRMETSRRRMGGDNDPAVPTPPNPGVTSQEPS
jgi:hypothetical protein